MKALKIEVMTETGLVSFHVDENEGKCPWNDLKGKLVFKKLSGKDISFVESNVIYINEIIVNDNTGGDSIE